MALITTCIRIRTTCLTLIRTYIVYIVLLFYILLGAAVFYLLESMGKQVEVMPKCIAEQYDVAAASTFYALAACTTIGYGTLYPCTLPSRILTVPFSIVGMGLLVITVNDVGTRVSVLCGRFLGLIAKCRQKRRYRSEKHRFLGSESSSAAKLFHDSMREYWTTDTIGDRIRKGRLSKMSNSESNNNQLAENGADVINFVDVDPPDSNEVRLKKSPISLKRVPRPVRDIPISIVAVLFIPTFTLCTLYFYLYEEFGFMNAMFHAWLTLLLGDFSVANFRAAVPAFSLIFCGFSVVGTTVKIVQKNIDNIIGRIKAGCKMKVMNAQDPMKCDADELIADEVRQNASRAMAKMISASDMQNLKEFVATQQELAALNNRLAALGRGLDVVDAQVQCGQPPVRHADLTTQTRIVERRETAVDAVLKTIDAEVQPPQRPSPKDAAAQAVPETRTVGFTVKDSSTKKWK